MDNQNVPHLFNGDNGDIPATEPPKVSLKNVDIKTKITKNKMNSLKITKKQGIIFLTVVLVLMFLATFISNLPDGMNDPLNLIDYTPEEREALANNGFKWQSYQTEIESHEMIVQQLRNEQSKLAKANEDIRNSVKSRIQSVAFQ